MSPSRGLRSTEAEPRPRLGHCTRTKRNLSGPFLESATFSGEGGQTVAMVQAGPGSPDIPGRDCGLMAKSCSPTLAESGFASLLESCGGNSPNGKLKSLSQYTPAAPPTALHAGVLAHQEWDINDNNVPRVSRSNSFPLYPHSTSTATLAVLRPLSASYTPRFTPQLPVGFWEQPTTMS